MQKQICSICNRQLHEIHAERHHLTPRCKDGKESIIVCVDCGNQIHKLFTIKELEYKYNTLELLLAHPNIQTWIRWIKNKKEFGFCMKEKKRK